VTKSLPLHQVLIDVAPAPIFAGFERLDNRVLGVMIMFGGVTVGRVIAAADVAANEADAQMHPAAAYPQAIFAALRAFQGQSEWLRLLGLHEARLDGNGTSQISKPGKNDNYELTLIWLDRFYSVARTHPEMSAILANNNFSAAKLTRDTERVTALLTANRRQDEAFAAKKQAVKDRNAAFRAFKPWLRRAQKVADIVKKEHAAQEETTPVSIAL
jgi:hypothetical protein